MPKSTLNDAYIALRNLLRTRFLSAETREQATRAVGELHKEAITETLMTIEHPSGDDSSNAA